MRHLHAKRHSAEKGFTLIEMLVVMGIIAALAGMVITAVNPAKQFAQARNAERQSGVTAILNAVGQRIADNKGIFAGTFGVNGTNFTCPSLPNVATAIAAQGGIDLACLTPTYLPSQIPVDPSGGTWTSPLAYASGYTVSSDALGRVTVCAPNAASESMVPGAAPICQTR